MTDLVVAAPDPNRMSAKLAGLAPKAKARDVFAALGEPGFGVLAIALGLLLLLPFRWVLPQIVGLVLLLNALRLFGRKPAALPFLGGVSAPTAPVAKAFTWLEGAARPRLSQWAADFAGPIAALALLLAGVAALAPTSHLLVALGLIALGAGLAEKDGAFTAIGVAVCICAGFYVLTMLGGLAAGQEFARAWAGEHLPGFKVPR